MSNRRSGWSAARAGTIVLALAAVSYVLVEPARSQAGVAQMPAGADVLTPSLLARKLRNATRLRTLPANLQPSLAADRVPIYIPCGQGRAAVRIEPCIYGDTKSHTSVVVFGDSHAKMWLPALTVIAKAQHWRIVGLVKSGCPAAEVSLASWFLNGGLYSACSRWRSAAMARIAALHPRVVIVAWARWLEELEARPTPGIPAGYGSPWLDGVAAAFSYLRRAARRVVFISDIPTLRWSAPDCLAAHESDVRACAPTRNDAIRLPAVRAQELGLAQRDGVTSIDPTPWFCTPTVCPIVVGNILVYHDDSHMTKQWAQFITPVLAHAIVPIVRRGAR